MSETRYPGRGLTFVVVSSIVFWVFVLLLLFR